MAGDWIIWRKGLVTKKKVTELADILGVTDHHAAAAVMMVQEWLDSNIYQTDIDSDRHAFVTMRKRNVAYLDTVSVTPGMGQALEKVGWLVVENGVWKFWHAGEHNGQTAKDRGLAQKRQHKKRSKSRHDNVTLGALPQKRTEENILNSILSDTGRTVSKRPTRRIQLNRTTWEWEGITPEDREIWGRAYPACDIDNELSKMIAWSRAAGAKGQKSNWSAFITRWLAKTQDFGGSNRSPATKSQPTISDMVEGARRIIRESR
jgi:hypothetical protein